GAGGLARRVGTAPRPRLVVLAALALSLPPQQSPPPPGPGLQQRGAPPILPGRQGAFPRTGRAWRGRGLWSLQLVPPVGPLLRCPGLDGASRGRCRDKIDGALQPFQRSCRRGGARARHPGSPPRLCCEETKRV